MGFFTKKKDEPEKPEVKRKTGIFGILRNDSDTKNDNSDQKGNSQPTQNRVNQTSQRQPQPSNFRQAETNNNNNRPIITEEEKREIREGFANMKKEIDENPEAKEAFSALGALFGQAARGFANMVNEAQKDNLQQQQRQDRLQQNNNFVNTNSNEYKKGYQDGYQVGYQEGVNKSNEKAQQSSDNSIRSGSLRAGIAANIAVGLDRETNNLGARLRDDRNMLNTKNMAVVETAKTVDWEKINREPYEAISYDFDLDPKIISYLFSLDGTPYTDEAPKQSFRDIIKQRTTTINLNQRAARGIESRAASSIKQLTPVGSMAMNMNASDLSKYAIKNKMVVATSDEKEEKKKEVENYGEPTVKQWDNPENPFMANDTLETWFKKYFEIDDASEYRGYFVDIKGGKI